MPPKIFFFSQKIFECYCQLIFKIYTPLKVFGQENIPRSSLILASNHCSHMDTAVLAVATKRGFTKLGMLAAKDYWFDSFWRFVLVNSFLNLIPVDRNQNSHERISLERTIESCNRFISGKKNRGIVIYPEGTRSLNGQLLPLKNGAAVFAAKLNLPLLPIYIKGTFSAWPKGKFLIKPKRISVFIGKPIYPHTVILKKHLAEWNKKEIGPQIKKLTEVLERAMKELEYQYG